MTIVKGTVQYVVKECGNYWSLKKSMGKINVEYKIDKSIAGNFDSLEQYVLSDDMF